MILCQFDVPKKKKKKDLVPNDPNDPNLASVDEDEPEMMEDEIDKLVRVLDKEEKEMDEGDEADNEESDKLLRDLELIEEAMEEEIKGVSMLAKPVCEVLFKVGTLGPRGFSNFFSLWLPSFFFWIPFLSSIVI
jgi:hypothetical protein